MNQKIIHISLLVKDYDEAIEYYTKKLNFNLIEDSVLDEKKRWVIIAPPGSNETSILLAEAATKSQKDCIGNQSGGRVFLFLHTNDFWLDYKKMKDKGINFIEKPRKEKYGDVVVFKDLYGNKWDLIQIIDNVISDINKNKIGISND